VNESAARSARTIWLPNTSAALTKGDAMPALQQAICA
jgi:hypothetical protein